MIAEYVLLAGRIRRELGDLDKAIARAAKAVNGARRQQEDSELFIDAAALNLHDFYTGLERVFQQIGELVDDSVPSGSEWHRNLLEQMCIEFPDVRPAVLSEATCRALGEFMRFRHVVRNIYASSLDAGRVVNLVEDGERLSERIRVELEEFAAFLETLGGRD